MSTAHPAVRTAIFAFSAVAALLTTLWLTATALEHAYVIRTRWLDLMSAQGHAGAFILAAATAVLSAVLWSAASPRDRRHEPSSLGLCFLCIAGTLCACLYLAAVMALAESSEPLNAFGALLSTAAFIGAFPIAFSALCFLILLYDALPGAIQQILAPLICDREAPHETD